MSKEDLLRRLFDGAEVDIEFENHQSNIAPDIKESILRSHHNSLMREEVMKPGDLVMFKPEVRYRKFPEERHPAIMHRVFPESPIVVPCSEHGLNEPFCKYYADCTILAVSPSGTVIETPMIMRYLQPYTPKQDDEPEGA